MPKWSQNDLNGSAPIRSDSPRWGHIFRGRRGHGTPAHPLLAFIILFFSFAQVFNLKSSEHEQSNLSIEQMKKSEKNWAKLTKKLRFRLKLTKIDDFRPSGGINWDYKITCRLTLLICP